MPVRPGQPVPRSPASRPGCNSIARPWADRVPRPSAVPPASPGTSLPCRAPARSCCASPRPTDSVPAPCCSPQCPWPFRRRTRRQSSSSPHSRARRRVAPTLPPAWDPVRWPWSGWIPSRWQWIQFAGLGQAGNGSVIVLRALRGVRRCRRALHLRQAARERVVQFLVLLHRRFALFDGLVVGFLLLLGHAAFLLLGESRRVAPRRGLRRLVHLRVLGSPLFRDLL